MANLVILEPAQRELEEIAQLHLNLVGPNSARNITNLILNTLSRLEMFPLSGHIPQDKELRNGGYRYVIAGKYICVYRLIAETVYVYHIAHGASNYPTLFKRLLKEENQSRFARNIRKTSRLAFNAGLLVCIEDDETENDDDENRPQGGRGETVEKTVSTTDPECGMFVKGEHERVFADAKEKHAMRYTHHRGLAAVTRWVRLKFAAMNLKKLANWSWKNSISRFIFVQCCPNYTKSPAFVI